MAAIFCISTVHTLCTDYTGTSAPRVERIINHIPDGSFPPPSEEGQLCALSITFLHRQASESAVGVKTGRPTPPLRFLKRIS